MWLGLVLFVIGLVVIAAPDSDERLFSISRTHGPSALDAVGVVVTLVGWAVLLRVMWRSREAVRRSRGFAPGVIAFLAGALIVAIAVPLDLRWWWTGVALMVAVQAAALGVARGAAKSP